MRKLVGITLWLGLLAGAGPAAAQMGRWAIGGGALVPGGEYSTHDRAGWLVSAAFLPLRSTSKVMALRVNALYGLTPRKTTSKVGTSRLFGVEAAAQWQPGWGHVVSPYLVGGIGYYAEYEGTTGGGLAPPNAGTTLSGGGGLSVGRRVVHFFVEARFVAGPAGHSLNFAPITLGASLGRV